MSKLDGSTDINYIEDLMYQLLEAELGSREIYRVALQAAINRELRDAWGTNLERSEKHVAIARDLIESAGLDPDVETPARRLVQNAYVMVIQNILDSIMAGDPIAAEITAVEALTEVEAKGDENWLRLKVIADRKSKALAPLLKVAIDRFEEDRPQHHTSWPRELWRQTLGLPPVPPEQPETANVRDAIKQAPDEPSRSRS